METVQNRSDPPAHKLRILVIEDDADVREALADVLRDEGFEVCAAHDGREAMNELGGGFLADLILLDLMMPRMNGWEFRALQRSSNDPAIASIPVVVVSAYMRESDRAGLDAAAFLDKPLGLEALAQLRRLADEAQRRRAVRPTSTAPPRHP